MALGRKLSNPLDPYAFDYEPDPFIIRGKATDREAHLGVHTATDYERAVLYAVQRAMSEGSIGVVLHLDVQGLQPLPDRDAMIEASQSYPGWILEGEGVSEALEQGDPDELRDALDDLNESVEPPMEDSIPNTWFEGAYAEIERNHEMSVLPTLIELEDEDLLSAIECVESRDVLPQEIIMGLVGQQRYMSPIGFDRVVQVDLIRPVRIELFSGSDFPPDNPDEPQIFCLEDFAEESWVPDIQTVWRDNRPPGAVIEYHGTDISRAARAFPELEPYLDNPWPYTQPQIDRTPSPFAAPQEFVERLSASQKGVGIFPIAESTGRVLLGLRSWAVEDPGQWAGFGGLAGAYEDPEVAALRELREETGYVGNIPLEEIEPSIFIGHVYQEFRPKLNWETEKAGWFTLDEIENLNSLHWSTKLFLEKV